MTEEEIIKLARDLYTGPFGNRLGVGGAFASADAFAAEIAKREAKRAEVVRELLDHSASKAAAVIRNSNRCVIATANDVVHIVERNQRGQLFALDRRTNPPDACPLAERDGWFYVVYPDGLEVRINDAEDRP